MLGELLSDFSKTSTEFHQISLNLKTYLTDFSPQPMVCTSLIFLNYFYGIDRVKPTFQLVEKLP